MCRNIWSLAATPASEGCRTFSGVALEDWITRGGPWRLKTGPSSCLLSTSCPPFFLSTVYFLPHFYLSDIYFLFTLLPVWCLLPVAPPSRQEEVKSQLHRPLPFRLPMAMPSPLYRLYLWNWKSKQALPPLDADSRVFMVTIRRHKYLI